ncbi:MAG: site-specific recombinase XerC [Verrucomicrobiales bacterium]|jgi:site-specific recombinase XerC
MPLIVQELLGYEDVTTTEGYTNASPGELSKQRQRIKAEVRENLAHIQIRRDPRQ